MEKFVKELNEEIEHLDSQIDSVKQQIQHYSVRGATTEDNTKREDKIVIFNFCEEKLSLIKIGYYSKT